MRERLILILGALLLAVGCSEAPSEARVLTPIERGPLEYRGYFYGELIARKSEAVHTPEFTSVHMVTIDTVLEDGAPVKAGDVVLTFVRDEVEAEFRAKQADHAVAQANYRKEVEALERERIDLALAIRRYELDLEKAKLFVLEGVNFISKVELEKAKLDVARSELELKNAKKKLHSFAAKKAAALQVAKLKVDNQKEEVDRRQSDLDRMELKAPADGVLYAPYTRMNWVRGKAESGRVTRPGDKLLELPDLTHFNVQVAVRQKDAKLIAEDDEVLVYPAADPERALKGVVKSKESFATTRNERLGTESVEGNLKEVNIVVELESSPSFLRPGGSARVEIRSRRADDVLRVPLAALREVENGFAVELQSGEIKPVVVGRTTNTFAEILEGVIEGDQVAFSQ